MTKADEVWYRLELLCARPEPVVSTLWARGALGVEVQDVDTFMEDGSIAPVPEGMTRLIAFFDTPFDDSSVDGCEVVSNARYDDRSWETAWKKYFRPVAISERAVVGPPWESFEAPTGGVKIVIEPGMAFGTGTHETTGLCAALLDEAIATSEPQSFLDVGCGTGILSMIAVGLGVPRVVGVDVDENAVEIAVENLRLNAMAGTAHFSTTPLRRLGTFDVVVANILARILLEIQTDLVLRVKRNGSLILSGITTEQAEEFLAAFDASDLELVEQRARGEWVALVFRKR